MHVLMRGNIRNRLRIASGLYLFVFAFFHFINVGLGLVSPEAMDAFQQIRSIVTKSVLGTLLLYASLLIHAGLALVRLGRRNTLRMPFAEAIQLVFGLLIPLQLIVHIVHTRGMEAAFEVNAQLGFTMVLLWSTFGGWQQAALLLIVWIHGCIGINMWLRVLPAWKKFVPWMIGIAVFVPAFALAGFMVEGRRMRAEFADPELRAEWFDLFNWPDREVFAHMKRISEIATLVFAGLVILTLAVYVGRKILARRRSVRIRYVDGPEIAAPKGLTLLEMSRAAGVPHTALCGGRGRCTTCRVIVEEGANLLHPPSEIELRSLRAVNAPEGSRLACQIRPTDPAVVFRVFRPDGKKGRAHASQGKEENVAVLFVDMRGFTSRTTGQLPYDVVFLLNRFFDAIVPPIHAVGGHVDKYLGDGLLAVFETETEAESAKAALKAAQGMGEALEAFNKVLREEGSQSIEIGIGLHMGDLVVGEIGAAGAAPRTIIGEAVNTASRIEGKTKELGVELLITEPVLTNAGYPPSQDLLQMLDLRGVPHPVSAVALAKASMTTQLLEEIAKGEEQ